MWLVLAAAAVAFVVSFLLRAHTARVTWYELALLLLAAGLMTWAWVLLAPGVIHRLRPSSYEHRSTTGERLVLAALWAVLAGFAVTLATGPGWAPAVLLAVGLAGGFLLNRWQKRRIHGPDADG